MLLKHAARGRGALVQNLLLLRTFRRRQHAHKAAAARVFRGAPARALPGGVCGRWRRRGGGAATQAHHRRFAICLHLRVAVLQQRVAVLQQLLAVLQQLLAE